MSLIFGFLEIYFHNLYLKVSRYINTHYFEKRFLDDGKLRPFLQRIFVIGGFFGIIILIKINPTEAGFYCGLYLLGLIFLSSKEDYLKQIKAVIKYSFLGYVIIGTLLFVIFKINPSVVRQLNFQLFEDNLYLYFIVLLPLIFIVFNLISILISHLMTKLFRLHLNHCIEMSNKNKNTKPLSVALLHFDIIGAVITIIWIFF